MIEFPLVIAVSERDMPGVEPGPLGWHTSTLTNELQDVRTRITNTSEEKVNLNSEESTSSQLYPVELRCSLSEK